MTTMTTGTVVGCTRAKRKATEQSEGCDRGETRNDVSTKV